MGLNLKTNKQKKSSMVLSVLPTCFQTGWRLAYPESQCSTNGFQSCLEVLLPSQNTAGYQGAKPHCYLLQCYQTFFLFKLKQKKRDTSLSYTGALLRIMSAEVQHRSKDQTSEGEQQKKENQMMKQTTWHFLHRCFHPWKREHKP